MKSKKTHEILFISHFITFIQNLRKKCLSPNSRRFIFYRFLGFVIYNYLYNFGWNNKVRTW